MPSRLIKNAAMKIAASIGTGRFITQGIKKVLYNSKGMNCCFGVMRMRWQTAFATLCRQRCKHV